MDETEAASQLRIVAKAVFTPSLYLNCRGVIFALPDLDPTFSDNAVTSRISRPGMVFRNDASPRTPRFVPRGTPAPGGSADAGTGEKDVRFW